jgi:hypothetical protein
MATKQVVVEVEDEAPVKKDDWMQSHWRPMMGMMYMAVCIFDFILAPVLFTAVQFWEAHEANDAFRQWTPITLQATGFFHMAMGAVLCISAYGRTKEKCARIDADELEHENHSNNHN